MTVSVMLYGVLLGAFLAGAAHFTERAARALGRPGRGVWAVSMGLTALAPLGVVLLPAPTPVGNRGVMSLPLEALYGLAPAVPDARGAGPSLFSTLASILDRPLAAFWVVASTLALLAFWGAAVRLRHRSSRWPRHLAEEREILVSSDVGPALLGITRPRIVLPHWALTLEREALEMILLHEEEHIRARDPLLLAAGFVLLSLAPWNPALWWNLSRLRLAVEGDCDARVLGRGVRRTRYGALLLDVASGRRNTLFPSPALAEGGGRFLERRLQMMKHRVGKRSYWGALGGMSMAGLFLFLACETPIPPEATEEVGAPLPAAETADGQQTSFQVTEVDPDSDFVGYDVRLVGPVEGGALNGEAGRARFSPDGTVQLDQGVTVRLRQVGDENGPSGESHPLLFVDGVLQEVGMAAIDQIDPDNIERIEVIKGAAAQAVFGEEAADGVIQVYLKKK